MSQRLIQVEAYRGETMVEWIVVGNARAKTAAVREFERQGYRVVVREG